jgi:hypothetical protein
MQGSARDGGVAMAAGWEKIWEGGRPVDRRASEKLHLYQRQAATLSGK